MFDQGRSCVDWIDCQPHAVPLKATKMYGMELFGPSEAQSVTGTPSSSSSSNDRIPFQVHVRYLCRVEDAIIIFLHSCTNGNTLQRYNIETMGQIKMSIGGSTSPYAYRMLYVNWTWMLFSSRMIWRNLLVARIIIHDFIHVQDQAGFSGDAVDPCLMRRVGCVIQHPVREPISTIPVPSKWLSNNHI